MLPNEPLPVMRTEPRWLARMRTTGWGLLVFGGWLLVGRQLAGAADWIAGLAVGCLIFGLLAVINVSLVRALYAQIDTAPPPANSGGDGDQSI